jgi:hypothetical protein
MRPDLGERDIADWRSLKPYRPSELGMFTTFGETSLKVAMMISQGNSIWVLHTLLDYA